VNGWQIARGDILTLKGYRAAEQLPDTIRLNANEAPKPLSADIAGAGLNRYPDVHPLKLQACMADLFEVLPGNLLVTRGSSEAIDVVIRSFCRAYVDNLVTVTPTFEMYRFYADIQGVEVREMQLSGAQGFSIDVDAMLGRCDMNTKLIVICSPNNPTGNAVSNSDIVRLAEALRGKSIVVVDEAYIEFSPRESMATLIDTLDNLVVLRTLSKAHALAGARCGAAVACADLIDVFCRVLPPYSFPTPVVDRVLEIVTREERLLSAAAIEEIVKERARMFSALASLPCVAKVWPSEANFLLVRFTDIGRVLAALQARKILVRDFSSEPGLENCARITIGSGVENSALLEALATVGDAG
jgi:histidinol-phosphate aminotransferase